jgi:hypothetical protein
LEDEFFASLSLGELLVFIEEEVCECDRVVFIGVVAVGERGGDDVGDRVGNSDDYIYSGGGGGGGGGGDSAIILF